MIANHVILFSSIIIELIKLRAIYTRRVKRQYGIFCLKEELSIRYHSRFFQQLPHQMAA